MTDGGRVRVKFNGLTLGLFAGDLQFTAYKGCNLLRQEALASTQAKDVAFIYKAGLKGFAITRQLRSWCGATRRRCGRRRILAAM